jgi:diguanylate cyclase (GGDEF)-like protein
MSATAIVLLGALVALLLGLQLRHRRAVTRLERLARTDELTGLPNRRAWREELSRELARSTRDGTPVTVGLIDLDRFKIFNDRNGHQAGDRLLIGMASGSAQRLRTTDLIARYGGEEFALILPSCPGPRAYEIVDRLRHGVPGDETCSAGIACWDGHETADELMARADGALYDAKRAGRNRTMLAASVNGDGNGSL